MNEVETKYFNITGPCIQSDHYMLPVLGRVPDVNTLINQKKYFVLHAPRQSGKTTYIQALADEINNNGQYYALYCSLEALRGINKLDKCMLLMIDPLIYA